MASRKPTRKHSGSMRVTLANLSEDTVEIILARGSTLRTALLKAGFSASELEDMLQRVRVGGQEANLSDRLSAGDFITVAPNVQGGSR